MRCIKFMQVLVGWLVGYLTLPYLLPFHHCWEMRSVRGWLGRESEKHWENWRFAGWETVREWKGNEEEISVLVSEVARGSFALPPSARSHRGWMACYIMPASISFFKSHRWSHNTSSAPCLYLTHCTLCSQYTKCQLGTYRRFSAVTSSVLLEI